MKRILLQGPIKAFVVLAVWVSSQCGLAADPRIEEVTVDTAGRLRIGFPAEVSHYYRLLRGEGPGDIRRPVMIGLNGPFAVEAPVETGFFRLEELVRDTPMDTDGDGRDDLMELAGGTDPLVVDPSPLAATQFASSPADGESGVSVRRETVLRFTRPLAEDTVLEGSRLFAEAAGRRVLTRSELSPDRRKATLYYLEPLPGGTRVVVTLDGVDIRDVEGRLLDADGDGIEGGTGRIAFDTFNSQTVPGTEVVGRVFASELVAGPGTGTNAVDRPLKGVTITVDGREETLRAVTDADGNFRLKNAPAGRFFVHIDGRTAEASHWPGGDYYPFIGKAWEAVAGQQDNRAGVTGMIYLPLIPAGTLRPVSAVGPTYVTFLPSVVAANPDLDGVSLMVPPNALSDDTGTRGGRVGIAPVPPNRLPEALPDDLQFPLVITVQTDGPAQFTEPVPVCFPNLPDPTTGRALAPGAKSALWSFDHDKGYWEIVGPMTVSADGRRICSDPGFGISQPGWHGTLPGTSGSGGGARQPTKQCRVAVLGPGSTYTNRWATFTTTTASQGGAWSWSAPGGEPSSGMGPEFQVRFAREGTYRIAVRYTMPNGKTQCQAEQSLRVTPLPCEISLNGPVRVPESTLTRFRASGTPVGGRYRWTMEGGGYVQGVDGGEPNGPEVEVLWTSTGDYKLTVEYTAKPGTPDEQKCTADRLVSVGPSLRVLDDSNREVGLTTFVEVDEEVIWKGNLSDLSGDYRWSSSSTVEIGDPEDAVSSLIFTRPGLQSVTLTYTSHEEGEQPKSRTVTVRVRDRCEITVVDGIRQDIPKNQELHFEVTTRPESGGSVRWSAPGGSPSTGTGRTFTTRYATEGPKLIDAQFTNPNGDVCSDTAAVHIGPISCQLAVSGPSALLTVDGFVYEARRQGGPPGAYSAESFTAILVETGEVLGTGQPNPGEPFRFLFAPALLSPGPYTIRVHYNAIAHIAFEASCSVDYPVVVTSPSPALSRAGLETAGSLDTESAPGRHLYLRINERTGTSSRGTGGAHGVVHPTPVRLPADTAFRQYLLHPETFMIAVAEFVTPSEGQSFTFPEFVFQPDLGPDGDGDGLTDLAERIVGSDPGKQDTDGDGVTDAAEVRAGSSPTEADAHGPGPAAVAGMGGYAWDVALDGDRALVAAGPAGLALFNVFERLRPIRIGQADTPGEAGAVASSGDWAAVADGAAGLALVDLRTAPPLAVAHQLPLGAPVTSVAVARGTVFAGLATGFIVGVDPVTGTELMRRDLDGSVEDLVVQDRWLYALTWRQGRMRVTTYSLENGNLESRSELELNGQKGAGGRRLRLARVGDRLFAVSTQGYAVLNLSRPSDPVLDTEVVTPQAGWRQVAVTAGGLLVAAADAVSTDEGSHDIQLHRLAPDGTTPQFELQIPTAGSAEAIVLQEGYAYVADGDAGLGVIRVQDADRAGRPPVVELRVPGTANAVEENRPVTLVAVAGDDVGVARVEFRVDGFPVAVDEQFPFEWTFTPPPRSPGHDTVRVQAVATDTGGNVGASPELILTLTGDVSAPAVVRTSPGSGQEVAGAPLSAVVAWLSETVVAESVTEANLRLTGIGPDNEFGTADDVVVGGTVLVGDEAERIGLAFAKPLNTGRYRATVGPGLRDATGNVSTETREWEFRVIGPKVVASIPKAFGTSAGYAIRIRFSRVMDPTTTLAALRVFSSGDDGSPDTPDDVPAKGLGIFEAGGTELVFRFGSPLDPGQYFIRVDSGATDAQGRVMHEPWGTYFYVAALDYGDGMRIEGGGNSLGELNTGVEYRLHLAGPVDLAIINPHWSTVSLRRPAGEVIVSDSLAIIRVRIPEAGNYVLGIARTENGQSSEFRVSLVEFTTASFEHDVAGQASLVLAGRSELSPGDVDEHLVTVEAGARYWISPNADNDTVCRLQWSVAAPDGTPLIINSSRCGDSLALDSLAGGVFRVRLEAIGFVVAPRLNLSRR